MLVLSRKAGQQIDIGGLITITCVEIRHNKVRIGIKCPRDLAVWRAELIERDAEAQRQMDAAALEQTEQKEWNGVIGY